MKKLARFRLSGNIFTAISLSIRINCMKCKWKQRQKEIENCLKRGNEWEWVSVYVCVSEVEGKGENNAFSYE